MALDVRVRINQASVAGKASFGIPLFLITKAENATPYAEYDRIAFTTAFADSTDVGKAGRLLFAQDNAPVKIAVYTSTSAAVAAIGEVVSKNWRQLVVFKGEGDVSTDKAISDAIAETTDKVLFLNIAAPSDLTAIKANNGGGRTFAFLYPAKSYGVAAVIGATASLDVGGFTYKNIKIKGLDPVTTLTDTAIDELHTNGGNTLLLKAGDIVTSEGKTVDGEYLDVIDSMDWIAQRIAYNTQKLLNNEPKLPYTNAGIASLESVTEGVLKEAYDNGMIAADDSGAPRYSVAFKNRSEMSEENIRNRIYTGGNFFFALAGAIHDADIYGELII